MSLNLKDLVNFGEGMILRDREKTDQKFAIHNANLQANRDQLIKMKDKKFDRDIKRYDEEKTKYDRIKSANAQFENGEISADLYASTVLPIINPGFKDLPEDQKLSDIAEYARSGKTASYTLAGTIDEIEKKAANETLAINNATTEAIKKAEGDSFLINKILRRKNLDTATLTDEVQSGIDAANVVDLTEQKITGGKDLKGEGDGSAKKIAVVSERTKKTTGYKKFRETNISQSDQLKKSNAKRDSIDNKLLIVKSGNELNIANINDYFELTSEGTIKKFKKGGEGFANSNFSQFKMYKDYIISPGTDTLFLAMKGDAVNLIPYYDKENASGVVANHIKKYAVPQANGNISGEGGELNFNTIFRNEDNLIIVPTANTINFDDNILGLGISANGSKTINGYDINDVKNIYAQTLINLSKNKNGEFNPKKLKTIQSSLENLKYGGYNDTLGQVNVNFAINLVNNGVLSKEEFLSNESFKKFYDTTKNEKIKNIIDNPKRVKKSEGSTETLPKFEGKTITVTLDGETKNLQDNEQTRNFLEKKKSEGSTVIIEGEGQDTSVLDNEEVNANVKVEVPFVTKALELAKIGTINDADLLRLGDEVRLNQIPSNLRSRLFRLQRERNKQRIDERNKEFNRKVEERRLKILNERNKNLTSNIIDNDPNADI